MMKRCAPYALASSVSLITFLVHLSSLRNDFTGWDDVRFITENPHIRSMNAAFFRWAFFDFQWSNWYPLTWMSHALDYALWGANPVGHHLTSITLHAINTFLVVALTVRLLHVANEETVKKGLLPYLNERAMLITGGVAGMLFGLHPMHVESAAWIAERKDVLCALFYVLSVMTYSYAVTQPSRTGGPRQGSELFSNKYYLLSLGFFALALLSKPMAVTLPLVLLVLDWYPFDRMPSFRKAVTALVEKLPFIALSLAASILTILAQRAGGAMVVMQFVPLSARLLVAVKALIAYLGKMTVPLKLIPFYAYPENITLYSWEYLSALALVSGITIVCVLMVRKQKLWLSAWGYYVVTLLPVLGIVQVGGQSMADRYTYLPSLGPFLIAGLAVAAGAEKLYTAMRRKLVAAVIMTALAGLLLASLSLMTVKQIGIWKNGITLWSSVIEQEPTRSPRAYNNRGLVHLQANRFADAINDYTMAITQNPSYDEAYLGRGQAYLGLGQSAKAIDDLTRALELKPSYYEAYNSRGIALQGMGRIDEAIRDYSTALEIRPSDPRLHNNRGIVYFKAGKYNESIADYTAAIALEPSSFTSYNNRALALKKMGRLHEAIDDCTAAIAREPKFVNAYLNRGNLYLGTKNRVLAEKDFQQACDLGSQAGCTAVRRHKQERIF
jgi:tetratricopeptide (TPR) repeat protein